MQENTPSSILKGREKISACPMFHIFSFLFPHKEPAAGEVDRLFATMYGFIDNQSLVASIWQEYLKIKDLPELERDWAYVRTYLNLERFVLANKPPVVRNEFTRESLTSTLSLIINHKNLPPPLRLLFVGEIEQACMLFQLAMTDVSVLVKSSLGQEKLTSIVSTISQGTALERLRVTPEGTLDFTEALILGKAVSLSEILLVLRKVFQALFSEVQNAFGSNVPGETVKKTFKKISNAYTHEIISRFFDFVPEGILPEERVSFLSREELERRIAAGVDSEREKTKEAERLAAELNEKVVELEESKKRLEKMNEIMVGREIVMRELKKEIEELKEKIVHGR